MKRELINVCQGWNQGNVALMVIEKLQDEEGNMRKVARYIPDPDFHFYVSKEPLDVYRTFVEEELVDRVDCKYSELSSEIAKHSNRMGEYRAAMAGKNPYKELRKLHFCKDVHSSDMNIVDYTMYEHYLKHKDNLAEFKLHKTYFDIEVDGYNYDDGFPHPDIAPCPINFISYVDGDKKTLRLYILLNEENKSMQEFIARNKGDCTNLWTHTNNDYIRNELENIYVDEKNPKNNLEGISVYWFKSELSLIKKFYEHVHANKADYLSAWNAYFDFKTIYTRLKEHFGLDPEDIMCPEAFKVKNITLREDKFQADLADKADTLDISGWQHNVDAQYLFAGLRKGEGKRESLKLGDVLLEELGEAKGEYEGTISEAAYVNFELFMRYSGFDSYRLMQLENKNGDIDTLHMMANKLSHTRHAKVMRKTISIRNLAAKQFATKGLILSNNQNSFIEHEDFGKFKGALAY